MNQVHSETQSLVYQTPKAQSRLTKRVAYGTVATTFIIIATGIGLAKCDSCDERVRTMGKALFATGVILMIAIIFTATICALKKRDRV